MFEERIRVKDHTFSPCEEIFDTEVEKRFGAEQELF